MATRYRMTCPIDPSHGRLYDWVSERFGFYCPHWAHDGFKDRPATRRFFTTEEAETGALDPAIGAAPAQPTSPTTR